MVTGTFPVVPQVDTLIGVNIMHIKKRVKNGEGDQDQYTYITIISFPHKSDKNIKKCGKLNTKMGMKNYPAVQ
jgi:hypothetical protein